MEDRCRIRQELLNSWRLTSKSELYERLAQQAIRRGPDPDAGLLDSAGIALSAELDRGDRPDWRVINRQERLRSTVFELCAEYADLSVHLFYKIEHLPHDSKRQVSLEELQRRYRSLTVERILAPELSRSFKEAQVRFDAPVIIEPDLLTGIRWRVSGKSLGRMISYGLPWKRTTGRMLYESVGSAVRLIEEVGGSHGPSLTEYECRERVLRDVRGADRYLPAGLRAHVLRVAEDLMGRVDFKKLPIWTHGDLSRTNILIKGSRVGFIDFSWTPQLAGRDIAQLLVRQQGESLQRNGSSSIAKALGRPW